MGVVSRYMEDSFGKWHVQCTNKDTTLYIEDSCHKLPFILYVHCTSSSDIILLLEIPIQHYNYTITKKQFPTTQ